VKNPTSRLLSIVLHFEAIHNSLSVRRPFLVGLAFEPASARLMLTGLMAPPAAMRRRLSLRLCMT
jgi:hypothetical protein